MNSSISHNELHGKNHYTSWLTKGGEREKERNKERNDLASTTGIPPADVANGNIFTCSVSVTDHSHIYPKLSWPIARQSTLTIILGLATVAKPAHYILGSNPLYCSSSHAHILLSAMTTMNIRHTIIV